MCQGPFPCTADLTQLRAGAGGMWAEAEGPQGSLQVPAQWFVMLQGVSTARGTTGV